jgi:hypothetical protein
MLCKLVKAFFVLSDPLFCAFLRIHILQDRHRPLDLTGRVAKGCRAHPHPSLTTVVRRVDEVHSREDGFSPKRSRAWIIIQSEQLPLRIVSSPSPGWFEIMRGHHCAP